MVRTWLAIAKAEFQVLSSSLRGNRRLYVGILYVLALVWATIITPMLYNAILSVLFPMEYLRPILMVMFPGIMRTIGLFLWLLLLLFPLSYALQEIKIGQWEIFLSNNVRTKDIMAGTFIGKLGLYGLMFFLPTLSEMMGMNAFLLLPSTWFSDLISWLAISFNGIGLTSSQILGFSSVLQVDMVWTSILAIGFTLGTVGLALGTADRVFTIEAGVRTEVVTTVGRENIFLRGVRRVNSGPFGSLMVTNFKDFLRKAQNLSKIGYGLILAIIMPVIMLALDIEYYQFREMFMMLVIMMSLIGSMPFAGTGFLESKDQLWIIQGAPHGASRYVKSRIASQALIGIPLAAIPSAVIYFMIEMTFTELLILLGIGYVAVIGGMLIATGVTARNPNYEDTKSPAHQANMMTSVMLAEFSIMGVLFADIFLTIGTGIDFFGMIGDFFGPGNMMFGVSVLGLIVQWTIAILLVRSGIRYLSKPEA